MHNNSLQAFEEARQQLNERQSKIFRVVERYPSITDRGILMELELSDMNMVRPRVTELIKLGLIHETGSITCAITGRKCRTVSKTAVEHEGQLRMFGL